MHGVPVISIRHITWESFQRATPGERLRLCVTRHSNIATQCGSSDYCLFLFCLLIICSTLSYWWLEKVCVARSLLMCLCRHCGGARACVLIWILSHACIRIEKNTPAPSFPPPFKCTRRMYQLLFGKWGITVELLHEPPSSQHVYCLHARTRARAHTHLLLSL